MIADGFDFSSSPSYNFMGVSSLCISQIFYLKNLHFSIRNNRKQQNCHRNAWKERKVKSVRWGALKETRCLCINFKTVENCWTVTVSIRMFYNWIETT